MRRTGMAAYWKLHFREAEGHSQAAVDADPRSWLHAGLGRPRPSLTNERADDEVGPDGAAVAHAPADEEGAEEGVGGEAAGEARHERCLAERSRVPPRSSRRSSSSSTDFPALKGGGRPASGRPPSACNAVRDPSSVRSAARGRSEAPGALRGGCAAARVAASDDAPPPGHETHLTASLTLSIIFSAVCLTFPTVWSS